MSILDPIIQALPYLSLIILYSITTAYISREIFYFLKRYRKSKEAETATDKFYKLTFELLKLYHDEDILIPRISRIFIQTSGISEIDPNFYHSLIDNLQKLETKILGKDAGLNITDISQEDQTFYLDIINEIIETIERDHPYFGLNEDELSFFEDLKRETETGNIENALVKLIELSKRIKTKNIIMTQLNEKAKKTDFYSILSLILGVLSILATLWGIWISINH